MIDKEGNDIAREVGITTKTGFIFYTVDGKDWKIRYPNGDERHSRGTPEKICKFFKALADGKTIDEANEVFYG